MRVACSEPQAPSPCAYRRSFVAVCLCPCPISALASKLGTGTHSVTSSNVAVFCDPCTLCHQLAESSRHRPLSGLACSQSHAKCMEVCRRLRAESAAAESCMKGPSLGAVPGYRLPYGSIRLHTYKNLQLYGTRLQYICTKCMYI